MTDEKKIAPRIDENGEPWCSAGECPQWPDNELLICKHMHAGICTEALRRQRDEAEDRRDAAEEKAFQLRKHIDRLFIAGDRVCGEAMQMTVSVPRKQCEQADRLEEAVNLFRGACLNRAALAEKE